MRRLLLFFAATLFLCGAVNAQGWDTPDSHAKSSNTPIVASVQIDGVAPTLTEDFRLAAFVGDEVRGIAAAHTDGNFWIQVFYNQEDAETIYFCLWDGERIYASCDVTETTSEAGSGTPGAPVVLNFSSSTTETQTVALSSGTNWFSTYLEISLEDLEAAMAAQLGTSATATIKSQDASVKYSRGRWGNTPANFVWDVARMYKIEVGSDIGFVLEGSPINPAEHTITVTTGSNWIGFPFAESMSVTDAFSGFAINGDAIKSETSNNKYSRNRWGTTGLTTLEPGKGYVYTSSESEDRPLTYPSSNK